MRAELEIIETLRLQLTAKQATIDALMTGFQTMAFPAVDGIEFDLLYQPAATIESLGGDWYDVFALPDDRIAFTIGDVCGRGLAAAVKMGQAKQAIKVAASLQVEDAMPIAVLRQANRVIFLNDHHVEFTTAIYGVIDTRNRTVTYSSAGHHPPILVTSGEDARVMPNHGFPLGVEPEMPDLLHEHSFTYESGSLLVLYTDGLIEFNRDDAEGLRRLLHASREAFDTRSVRPARFIVESVLQEELEHPDDVAVLTIMFR